MLQYLYRFFFIAILLSPLHLLASTNTPINYNLDLNLTQDEKTWLLDHKVLKAGNEFDYAPWDFNKDGKPTGYSIDYVNLLASKLGIKVSFVTDHWNDLTYMLETKKIDLLHTMFANSFRTNIIYTHSYKQLVFALYKNKHNKKLNSIEALKDQTLSIPKDDSSIIVLKKLYPQIKIIEPDSYVDALKDVILGRADATVMDTAVASYLSENYSLSDLTIVDEVKLPEDTIHYSYRIGVNAENEILQSILNKAIASVTDDEKKQLENKWFNKSAKKVKKIKFTKTEKKWIAQHPVVKFTGDPDWLPFEAFKEDGSYIGIVADHLKLIEQRTGLSFERIKPKSWSDALVKVKANEVDMISEVVTENFVSTKMYFTKPYIETPLVIIMKKTQSDHFLNDLSAISDKKIAYVSGYGYVDDLKKKYPNIHFQEVNTVQEGLEAVAAGKLDAFICTLVIGSYNIPQLGLSNLTVAGKLDIAMKLGFGIRKDSPMLLGIINKALASIDSTEKNEIVNKWVKVDIEEKIDWDLVLEIAGVAVIVIAFIVYSNRQLKRLVEQKTAKLSSLLKAFDQNVIASSTDKNGKITYVSDAFCEISGYSREELIGKPHNILRHPDMPKKLFADLWTTIKAGKNWHGEIKNRKKDGGFYWVDMTITVEKDKDGKVFRYDAIRHDITAKKAVEELTKTLEQKVEERTAELTKSEQKIKNVFATTSQGIWMVDNNAITQEVNNAMSNILGYPQDEIVGKHIFHFVNDENKKIFAEQMKTREHGQTSSYEIYLTRKNRVQIPCLFNATPILDENGVKVGAFAMVTDITEQKKLQAQIAEKENFVRTLLDSQEQIIITTDGKKIYTINKAFKKFYGVEVLEDFLKDYECICDTFDTSDPEHYLQKEMDELTWIEYVLVNPLMVHKARIIRDEQAYIFTVTGAELPIEGKNLISAVFTNITELEKVQKDLKNTNQKVMDSIEYASLIQGALLPDSQLMSSHFDDCFTLWRPKDVVGGDIYLFTEIRNKDEALLMVVDCTGHGVPGAFVTMLVKAIERQIIGVLEKTNEVVSPGKILGIFNRSIKHLLKQDQSESVSNAGFDGGILYYNKKNNIVRYAGANIPLFVKNSSSLEIFKGDRHSIGYKNSDRDYEFNDYEFDIRESTSFYISTDGFLDQNGGEKGFPFGKRRFKKLIEEHYNKSMKEQHIHFLDALHEYQGENERNDDVCLVALKVSNK
ncbi:transporter substrate-binding domain-containing protein [Sulfurimonas sp. C5]|uniref:PAS domain S-box protein n=1 Tax=Sulfurimonas sp. C5 TaxID=3036947 RepID=UPI0024586EDC|nr:transporter substrate-binding domain-containing protein [Sulfurimonas sp. C5]MDH4944830.1 transporter substrate-binding domain-containing protein [Sulfurimonas sp. C5]